MSVIPLRPRSGNGGDPPVDRPRFTRAMSAEEAQRLRAALRNLRSMAGSTRCLALMLGVSKSHVFQVIGGRRASYSIAVRAARLAGVPVEQLLGELAPVQTCPHCGASWGLR
jgi:hypothetical protein